MILWKKKKIINIKQNVNHQTIIGKEGTQHDICLQCETHYE